MALGEEAAHKALISSTKSMTAHMLGAAGAVETIASLMALNTGEIPPTIGYEQPDPECDLDYVPNKSRKANCTLAFSISLGFGGHNGCLALRPIQAGEGDDVNINAIEKLARIVQQYQLTMLDVTEG